MAKHKIRALVSLAALSFASIAAMALSSSVSGADTDAGKALNAYHVPGEKLDSGLGDMPPYRPGGKEQVAALREPAQAGYRVQGEKLDSGLGELPHYGAWTARHRWGSEIGAKHASR